MIATVQHSGKGNTMEIVKAQWLPGVARESEIKNGVQRISRAAKLLRMVL